MSRLPLVSDREAVAALGRLGWAVDHQTGSHMILRHRQPPHRRLCVPNHREIAKGTLRSILREAGLTVDEFIQQLKAQPNRRRSAPSAAHWASRS